MEGDRERERGAVESNSARVHYEQGYDMYYKVNVLGTRNLIAACQQAGVSTLVFTSSASVVFDGRDLKGATA